MLMRYPPPHIGRSDDPRCAGHRRAGVSHACKRRDDVGAAELSMLRAPAGALHLGTRGGGRRCATRTSFSAILAAMPVFAAAAFPRLVGAGISATGMTTFVIPDNNKELRSAMAVSNLWRSFRYAVRSMSRGFATLACGAAAALLVMAFSMSAHAQLLPPPDPPPPGQECVESTAAGRLCLTPPENLTLIRGRLYTSGNAYLPPATADSRGSGDIIYSITPALPDDLEHVGATVGSGPGSIVGIPATLQGPTTYMYRVTDAFEEDFVEVPFTIEVVEATGATITGNLTLPTGHILESAFGIGGGLVRVEGLENLALVPQVTQGTYGTFVLVAEGRWEYTVDRSIPATDALREGQDVEEVFTIAAAGDPNVTAQVTVQIRGVNSPPRTGTVTANVRGPDIRTSVGVPYTFNAVSNPLDGTPVLSDPEGEDLTWSASLGEAETIAADGFTTIPVEGDVANIEVTGSEVTITPLETGQPTRVFLAFFITATDSGGISRTVRSILLIDPPQGDVCVPGRFQPCLQGLPPDLVLNVNEFYNSIDEGVSFPLATAGFPDYTFHIYLQDGGSRMDPMLPDGLDWFGNRRGGGGQRLLRGTPTTLQEPTTYVYEVEDDEDDPPDRATFTIAVVEVVPTVTASGVYEVPEDAGVDTDVGAPLTATNFPDATPDSPAEWSITDGDPGDVFQISDAGQISVRSATLDHETTPTYTLTVQFEQGGSTATEDVTVSVTDVNEAPGTPVVANQNSMVGSPFSYQFAAVSDPDDGDTVAYTSTLADGSALPPWLTFSGADREFTGTPPASAEGDVLTVRVTATDDDDTLPLSSMADFTITVNPATTFTIGDASAPEGSGITFTVTLNSAVAGGLTVTPTYPNPGNADTATAGTDYTQNTDPIAFAGTAGETHTFTVETMDDADVEGDETFTVGLLVSGAAGTTATATGTIIDNDDATVMIAAPPAAAEGAALTFTVTLSAAVQGGLTVTPTYPGAADTATAGTDYIRNTTPIAFAGTAGETQTFTVATTDDAVVEGGETFTVGLMVSNAAGTVDATDTATGTITDNDDATVMIADAMAAEGTALTFTVTLDAAVQGGLTVTPTYPGAADTATAGTDYTRNTTPITFAGTAGETQTFTVAAADDTIVEGSEILTVGLSVSNAAGTVDMSDTATGTIADNDTAVVMIANAMAEEGTALTFTVTLSAAVQGGLTVTPTYPGATDTATAGTDYTQNTASISFTGTASETRTFTVETTEDAIAESSETFTVGLMASNAAGTVDATDTATGTITDDDNITVTIADATAAAEGTALTFTVTLNAAVQGGLTVTPTYPGAADTATAGTDYTRNTTPITFAGTPGETQTFTVSTTDDAVVEGAETFTVGLSVSGATGTVDATDTATGTITDDDTAAVTIADVTMVEGDDLTFMVMLDATVQGGLTVTPTYPDPGGDTATAGADYTQNAAPITFAGTAGETLPFTVSTTDDAVVEGSETLTVGLMVSNVAGTVDMSDTATGTITDNDDAAVTIANAMAEEGTALTFTVTLSEAVQGGLTVTPTYPGAADTATAGTDYTQNTAPIPFTGTAGEMQTFTVETTEDAIAESSETFTVGLSVSGAAGTVDATATATGTIADDDTAAVMIADATGVEGGDIMFTVTLTAEVTGGLTVTPTYTDGTATTGTDYTQNTAAIPFTGTAGEMHTFAVTTTQDTEAEGDETFTVGLSVSGTSILVAMDDTATGTIEDDDTPRVTIANAMAMEGEALMFTVTLDLAVTGGLMVTPTYADGTAVATDYMRNTLPISFAGTDGETHTFMVATTNDAIVEGDETFTVGLSVSGAGVMVAMTDTAIGTITDNDSSMVMIEDVTATEGSGLTFTVTLDAAVQGGLTVTPTYPNPGSVDTAASGTDYTENTAALTFDGTANETQTFTVLTANDAIVEGDETFTVGLSVSGAAGPVTMTDTATGTITDNDAAAVTIADVTAAEGSGLTFTVTLGAAVQSGLMVTPAYTDVTANSGTDYTQNTTALAFAGTAGETKTFTVATMNDAIVEGSETFTVGLMVSGAVGTVTMADTATGTITDNDAAAVTIADVSAAEGNDLTFTVTLSAAVQGGLMVTPTYADVTATSGTDYTRNTDPLAFDGTAGETETFTVSTAEDAIFEGSETFTVGLAVNGAAGTVTMTDTATGTITDNDAAAVTIADASVVEGSGITFTVTLSAAVQGGLTVTPTYTDATATSGTDYTRNTAALTFSGSAGETETFTVATMDDAIVEGAETFTVGLAVSGTSIPVAGDDTATGTITDNDAAAVTIADATAVEGSGITFTVTLSAAVQGGLMVTPTYTDVTAASGADYTQNTAALTFAGSVGETETFTVATADDAIVEGSETFTVGLSVSGAVGPVTMTDTATGTITDNDAAAVTIADATAAEGSDLTFTVTLDAAVQGGLTVAPTYPNPGSGDTATSVADYTRNTAALTFTGNVGETQMFMVATTDDAIVEGSETFTVGLMVSGAAGTVAMADTATGTITDADTAAVTIADASAVEGSGITFTVTLDAAVQGGLTVMPAYPNPGSVDTATSGTDYTQNTAALTFSGTAGETRMFTVMTTADTDVESDETFTVGLMVSGAAGTVTMADTATGTITDNDTAAVTIEAVSGAEGSPLAFTVRLDAVVQGGLTVTPTYPNPGNADTATSGTDYTQNTAALAFAGSAGEMQTFMVMTMDDAVVEGSETFTVGLSVSGAPGTVVATDTAIGTITDNDDSMVTVGDMTAAEGGGLTFTVTLGAAVQGGLAVTPAYPDPGGADTATAGADYTRNTAQITFAGTAGETQTFTVMTTDDAIVEGDETFTVGLMVSDAAGTVRMMDTATGTITDNDTATVTIADVTANMTAREGSDFTFEVTLDTAVQGGLTVTPTYPDPGGADTATAGADYTQNTAPITFTGTAGEMRTFTVAAADDDLVEGDETFTVGLSVSGAPGTVVATDTATGMITDADAATVTVGDASTAEGGVLTFTVSLDLQVVGGLTVTPTYTDVTAAAGIDYTQNAAALTFAGTAGETETFTVATMNDAIVEGSETFTVGLMVSGTSGTVGDADTATGTITDNDAAVVTIEDVTVAEGSGLAFTVTLDVEVQDGLTVTPTYTDATATAGADYTRNTAALTFAGTARETQMFTVATTDDAIVEDSETFTVGLMVSGTAGTVAMADTATGTITDNDESMVTVEDVTAVEGSGLAFTVTLDVEVQDGLTVTPAYPDPGGADTATVGDDYTRNAAALTFAGTVGETQTFTVMTTDDAVVEADETFTVGLMVSDAAGTVRMMDTATGTIEDNDMIMFNISDATAVEGDALSFTVTLKTEVEGVLTVPPTCALTVTPTYTDLSATEGIDYMRDLDPLCFTGEVGETQMFIVPTVVDDIAERREDFTIGLSVVGPQGPVGMEDTPTATGTITDDDTATAINLVILSEVVRAIADQVNNAIGRRIAGAGGDDNAAAAFRLDGQPASEMALAARGQAMADAQGNGIKAGMKDVLDGSSFVLPLKADGASSSTLSLWGNGDYRDLAGEESGLDWDGGLFSAHLGLDARLGDGFLAGVAVAWSEGDLEYGDSNPGTGIGRGDYELDAVGAYPYLGWNAPSEKLDLWVTGGIGEGELVITPEDGDRLKSDIELRTAGVGVSGRLLQADDLTLRLKAEALQSEMEVAGNGRVGPGRIAALDVDVSRLRLALEASHTRLLNGWRLGPSAELAIRHDGGDGRTGTGAEVGLGLRLGDLASGLTVEGKARGLLGHSGDYKEWGLQGLIRLDPGAEGRGLSFSVSPGYGDAASSVQEIWRQGLRRTEGQDEVGDSDDRNVGMRLDASLGYGLATPSGGGVVTPYMGVSLAEDTERSYRAGMRFTTGPAFSIDLEGEIENRGAGASGQQIILRGRLSR